jgi:hypothetical protein
MSLKKHTLQTCLAVVSWGLLMIVLFPRYYLSLYIHMLMTLRWVSDHCRGAVLFYLVYTSPSFNIRSCSIGSLGSIAGVCRPWAFRALAPFWRRCFSRRIALLVLALKTARANFSIGSIPLMEDFWAANRLLYRPKRVWDRPQSRARYWAPYLRAHP